jgi:hypothetical protein
MPNILRTLSLVAGATCALACPATQRGGRAGAGPTPPAPPAATGQPASAVDAARQRVAALVDQADRHYQEYLDIGAVVSTVDEAVAIARQYDLTDTVAARACILRGVIHVWMGEKEQAIRMFRFALTFDPAIQVPPIWGGPDVRAVIAEANLQLQAPRLPAPPARHTAVAAQTRDHPVPVWVDVQPSVPAASARLYHRSSLDAQGAVADMRRVGQGFYAELPCRTPPPEWWEYFVVVLDANGATVASAGSAESPFHVTIAERLDGPAPAYPDGSAIPACPAPPAAVPAP